MLKIDFVVTWVDGSDKDWINKRNFYLEDKKLGSDSGDNRYRDFGLLKNWFDRVWKFAPWVNNVYLVTDCQAPNWAVNDVRIKTINHLDFMNKEVLPTFNSNAIEMNIWRIKELSEHFVVFNDDMFLTKPVDPTDFFSNEGKPVLNGSLQAVVPRDNFSKIIFNNMVKINEMYPKKQFLKNNFLKHISPKYGIKDNFGTIISVPYSNWLGFNEDHLAYPNLKSWYKKLYDRMPEIFETTSHNRFRSDSDYSIWLLKNMYIASGNFSCRQHKFGKVMGFTGMKDIAELRNSLRKYSMVVINDMLNAEANIEIVTRELKKVMEL